MRAVNGGADVVENSDKGADEERKMSSRQFVDAQKLSFLMSCHA
jgi:hypothetical protein